MNGITFYITDRPEGKPDSTLLREVARWEMIARIDITRRGLPLRQLHVFACSDYRQSELGRKPILPGDARTGGVQRPRGSRRMAALVWPEGGGKEPPSP
ncbi:MAG: hypothetical protein K8R23_03240 [Chthoniobacter sp.]|nr:hypothetical protein [Chthoniobacter sp.]